MSATALTLQNVLYERKSDITDAEASPAARLHRKDSK
jgi:hypothetical protein